LILLVFLDQGRGAVRPPLGRPHLGYGANVADLKNASRLPEMGFGWMKGFLAWERMEPRPGDYDWTDLSKAIITARENNLRLLLRIDRAPAWARPHNPAPTAPPDPAFLEAWGDFLGALASTARGRVDAYEIWNEPNLAWQWGDQAPDPAYYVEMLRVAYQEIKAADPRALVVSAGLAPTGGDGGLTAMDNLAYLREMYALGAGPYFDVLGSHPYGFGGPPQADPWETASFRGVEREYQVMLEHGDGDKQVWATELGWMLDPAAVGRPECRERPAWRGLLEHLVSEEAQANYLVGAYQYAYENWPWMGVMFVFNLDFSLAPWYPDPCQPMAYYALLNPDGSGRQAFWALGEMPKRTDGSGGPGN
jgi:hypothetical protein